MAWQYHGLRRNVKLCLNLRGLLIARSQKSVASDFPLSILRAATRPFGVDGNFTIFLAAIFGGKT